VIGRDAGVEDCIHRASIMSGNIYFRKRRATSIKKLQGFGTKLRGGGGSVTLEYRRPEHTPVRTEGWYVSREKGRTKGKIRTDS